MALSTADFWKLCVESRLLSAADCQQRDAAYRSLPGVDARDVLKLAKWLIAQNALSVYHAKVLLSGRPGPFFYGEYRVDDLLTNGRRAGLFRATHLPTGHRVALFVLSGPAANDPARVMLARQKVEIARRAAHPLLCACYELVEAEGLKFIALEYLSGKSLEEHLAERGSLPLSEACRIGQLSALALCCLHEQGQSHAELRPANIWIGKSNEIKVLQAPLSRNPLAGLNSLNDSNSSDQQRLLVVADYAAPELTQSGHAPHPPGDVYALGCTLYQMLAGRVPFAGGDWRQKSARHATEAVEPLARVGVPAPLSKLVIEMLAKDPAQRPVMLQVAKGLVRHVTGPPVPAPTEPPTLNAYEQMLVQRWSPKPVPVAASPVTVAAPRSQSMAQAVDFSPPYESTLSRSSSKSNRNSGKRARRQYALLGGALVFLLCTMIAAVVTLKSDRGEPNLVTVPPPKTIRRPLPPPPQDVIPEDQTATMELSQRAPPIPSGAPPQVAALSEPSVLLTGVDEVDDDGHSLWASPTKGAPLKLADVAPGLQYFLVLRPAQLIEHPQGEKLLAAMGAPAASARQQIETIAGVPCSSIDQLTVVGYEPDDKPPALSFVVRLRRSTPLADLRKAWNNPAENSHNGRAYYLGPQWAYFLPPGEAEQLIVIADPARIKQIIEADGAPPPLPPRLEWLLAYTDNQRLLTIGFFPPTLSEDQGSLGDLPAALRERCAWLLGDAAKAALFSVHLGSELFAELRLRTSTEDPEQTASQLRQRLATIAEQAAGAANRSALSAAMMQAVMVYTRTGVEDSQAVARAYLPVGAAQHLVVAAESALGQHPISVASAGGSGGVAEKLAKKIDLSFPRDTLESAVALLSHEIGVPIEILGGDLQLEGITKNQSFGLDERQRPAGEILRKILWQANPDGKLVYVIKSKEPGGPEMLFLTTRAAAKKRRDAIPAELDQQTK